MYIISKELSKLANIRLINTLQAVRDTDQLLSQNREEAVRGKFEIINGVDLQNKTILLIDDVYTTGNTMREAIKTLRQANLLSIIPLVIAMNK
ncbi:MAG: ComF family protein [Fervidobacterium sp.]